jgi:hypothetical protein
MLNAEHFDCSSMFNCTASDLAALQWGSAGVTSNPRTILTKTDYMPITNSLFFWVTADRTMPTITEPLEYFFFTQSGYYTQDDINRYGAAPSLTVD